MWQWLAAMTVGLNGVAVVARAQSSHQRKRSNGGVVSGEASPAIVLAWRDQWPWHGLAALHMRPLTLARMQP